MKPSCLRLKVFLYIGQLIVQQIWEPIIITQIEHMNRVNFHILQDNTSVQFEQLKMLENPRPAQVNFLSQHFPVYPISINMFLDNPPFNKISLSFISKFCPVRAVLYGSENSLQYVKIKELTNLLDRQQEIIHIFQKKIFYPYVKILFESPPKSKENLCNQIKMKGIEFSMVTFFPSQFVCSLRAKLSYHPTLFRLLEVAEYKYLILKKDKNKLSEKYEKRLEEIVKLIDSKKIDPIFPPEAVLVKWRDEITYLESQPIHYDNFVELPDPVKTRKDISKLQKELQNFAVDRLAHVKPHVQHYFQKYQNTQIRENYLRQLSSPQKEDHNKALINFWNEVKKLQTFAHETEEAIIMFFNFYLQFLGNPLKISALKILILFDKNNPNPRSDALNTTYDRVLHNIIKYIHLKEDQQFYELCLKYCYMLYSRTDNTSFVKQLLDGYKNYSLAQQIQKLEILERVTFRGVEILDRRQTVQFLIDILLQKEITLTEKNRAYNVAAYLASLFGKETIMKDFQKLNSMILMTMQKNVDAKIGKIKKQTNQGNQQTDRNCEFCGIYSNKFKDENLYDLHLAKECKYITSCQFCAQNVEIPQLFKHYIEQCTHKHQFKHCDNCFQVIQLKDQQTHNKQCTRKLQTKCPLCYEKVPSKLKLKQHLLVSGCPNNSS